jgi:uncharacterized membrane protein YraQ (UPF0718 family)
MEVNPVTAARRPREHLLGLGVLMVLAVAGFFLIKWAPYWSRTFEVAVTHSLGPSILSGTEAAPPAPSIEAAVGYAVAYTQRIWQAMLLGLLLAATVDALLPRDWLARVLGSGAVRSSSLGGLFSLPGMM